MLRIEQITKTYGEVLALSEITLDVSAGEVLALLGPNGAGKSTLLSIVAGLVRPDSGQVWINGVEATDDHSAARSLLGLAPQETGIYPTVSVIDNLRFFGELAGLRGSKLKTRIADVADAFSLSDLLPRLGHSLSGGEARRLHTAMIVLHSPPLLLLDEPTAGVDVEKRAELLELVGALAEDGSAIVYSTHYLSEVEQISASSVAILVNGRIAGAGAVADLIQQRGRSFVDLHFSRVPVDLDLPTGAISISDRVVRVPCEGSPAAAAAQLLQRLGTQTAWLREIKLLEPSLESVFLTFTAGPEENGRHQ